MTVLASGSKGNATVVASAKTRVLVDAGLSCRELLRRLAEAGEVPESLDAILITHEHQDHVYGLATLARRLKIPVFFTEATHRAWVRMLTPRTTMTYAKWLDYMQQEKAARADAAAVAAAEFYATSEQAGRGEERSCRQAVDPAREQGFRGGLSTMPVPDASKADRFAAIAAISAEAASLESAPPNEPALRSDDLNAPAELALDPDAELDTEPCEPAATRSRARLDPTFLPAVEYFAAGQEFAIGDLNICPFTIPHDAADPCGFVIASRSENLRMAIATDLGYVPQNVKQALRNVDVLLLESNHDLEMLKDGPYPWSVKQRVLSRVGHLSNLAAAEFLARDYDGGAHTIVLGHLSEANNMPDLARLAAEQAIGDRLRLLGNRIVLASQEAPIEPVRL
jgi:phosphoribosyl 1,2-cyclic phosphodiesterase